MSLPLASEQGLEPRLSHPKCDVLPLHNSEMVADEGIEPTLNSL